MKKMLFILGVLMCLVSPELMFEGAVLGETIANIATVLGITGICLIGSQKRVLYCGGE